MGAKTLTPKRIELNEYYRDLINLDNFFENRITIADWAYIMKHYPNAWRNVALLRDSIESVITKMERGR